MSRHPSAQAGHAACWRAHPPEVAPGVPVRLSMLTRIALAVDHLDPDRRLHLSSGAVLCDETTSAVADRLRLHLEGHVGASDLRSGVAALLGHDPRQACDTVEFAIDGWIDENVVMIVMPEAPIRAAHPLSGAFNGMRDTWRRPLKPPSPAERRKGMSPPHPASTDQA